MKNVQIEKNIPVPTKLYREDSKPTYPSEEMEALDIKPPCPEPKEFKVEGTLKVK